MNLLLDTHIWIWALIQPEKLTGVILNQLKSKSNELWLSPISVWEALVLLEKQRIKIDLPSQEWLSQALERSKVTEAPLTFDVAARLFHVFLIEL